VTVRNHHSFLSKLAIGFLVLAVGLPVLAQTDETVLVGNDGTVTFETPVRIGRQVAPPGDYLVRHSTRRERSCRHIQEGLPVRW
jgi:hypothetical protein